MTSGATAAAFVALAPQFERATGHTVVTLATSTGIGTDSIASRVRRGDPVDVVILNRAAIDELVGEEIDYVGPLPPDVQRVTLFTAAVSAGAKNPDAARALLEFMTSPRAMEVMSKSGLDPIARR